MYAMSRGALVTAVVAVVGAVVAWRFLPAVPTTTSTHVDIRSAPSSCRPQPADAAGCATVSQTVAEISARPRPIGQLTPVPPRPQ